MLSFMNTRIRRINYLPMTIWLVLILSPTQLTITVMAFSSSTSTSTSTATTTTTTSSLLKGVSVTSVATGEPVDVGDYLVHNDSTNKNKGRSMIIFGTYAADFNAIEYAQRLRYYLPILQQSCQVTKCGLILNCNADAAKTMTMEVDLPTDVTINSNTNNKLIVNLMIDELGIAGREFGVGRGWLPDNNNINPFIKLFGMLWGLGAWATLPAVIGGYIGNPFVGQPWIEDAIAVGQQKGRWPNTVLEISSSPSSSSSSSSTDSSTSNDNAIVILKNKFSELPLVGDWPRRPLELATLRLQSMIGISLKKWKELAPNDQALEAGVLTQLGGCLVVDSNTGETLYEWKDPGICAVTNFEDVIKKLS